MNLYHKLNLPASWFRLALAASIIAISILAFAPLSGNINIGGSDKINHFIAFFVLSGLLDGSWQKTSFDSSKTLCVMLYALFIEIVQSQLPYRDFSWLDVIADAIGVLAYLICLKACEKILKI